MSNADIAIWGPPGTGKTTRLLEILSEKINETKINIQDVAFSTFRKPLAEEAKAKIRNKENMVKIPDDNHIGTTHSICYQLLKEERYDYSVAEPRDRKDFCGDFGVDYRIETKNKAGMSDVQQFNGKARGNMLFQINSYNRNNPNKNWADGPVTEEMLKKINDYLVEDFAKAWDRYKLENEMIDFCDMLEMTYEKELYPWVDVLFEDEFQDKTPLQYELYKMWAENIPEVVVTGDSLQAIYSFFGTEPTFFEQEYGGAEKQEIRPKSYRFSQELYEYARRIPEEVGMETPDIGGNEKYDTEVRFFDMNDFRRKVSIFRNESVLYLVRANFMKNDIVRILKDRGIPYVIGFGSNSKIKKLYNAVAYSRKNLDKRDFFASTKVNLKSRYAKQLLEAYPISHFDGTKKRLKEKVGDKKWIDLPVTPVFCSKMFKDNPFQGLLASANIDGKEMKELNELIHRRGGEPMDPNKRHIISTIHGSKGREADYVFLFADRTRRIAKEGERRNEARLFFVGSTRARKRLFIVDGPNREFQYNFP